MVRQWRDSGDTVGEVLVKYVAVSIKVWLQVHFGHIGLCQLCTKLDAGTWNIAEFQKYEH